MSVLLWVAIKGIVRTSWNSFPRDAEDFPNYQKQLPMQISPNWKCKERKICFATPALWDLDTRSNYTAAPNIALKPQTKVRTFLFLTQISYPTPILSQYEPPSHIHMFGKKSTASTFHSYTLVATHASALTNGEKTHINAVHSSQTLYSHTNPTWQSFLWNIIYAVLLFHARWEF